MSHLLKDLKMLNAGRYFRVLASSCALVVAANTFAAPVDSGPLNVGVPNSTEGIFFNVVTGVTATTQASAPAGWDFNPYASGVSLAFYWPTAAANTRGGVAVGGNYAPLDSGAVVGPASTFNDSLSPTFSANFRTSTGRKTLGFRFFNEADSMVHYGYIVMDTRANNGFPATVRRIVYEGTANTAITVPQVCDLAPASVSSLDIDGDCLVDPLTDGLLLTRAMMGLTGTAVINGAIGSAATRTTWSQIRLYLNQQFGSNYAL